MDVAAKKELLRQRKLEEEKLTHKIENAMKTGTLALDDDDVPRGCAGRFTCDLFRAQRRKVTVDIDVVRKTEKVQSATSARLFGQRGKQATAVAKLSSASDSMTARAEQLEKKVEEARKKVMGLKQAGKMTEALAALKRMKALEKQHATAIATSLALEQQVDLLQDSELQREVSNALSETAKSVKKKSKGLLSKAENAADDATEIRDLAEDVAHALGGLQQDTFDEDLLMEELNAMTRDENEEIAVEIEKEVPRFKAVAETVAKPSPAPVMKLANYPKVPNTKTEKKALLQRVEGLEAEE